MKYKLICIDMDGTLLNNKHEVTDENKEAIKKANEMGVKIAITTGRIFCSAKYYSDIIGVSTPIIASNGAYIREKDKDEVIYSNTIPNDLILKIYNTVHKHGLKLSFNTCNTLISSYELPENHAYKLMNKIVAKENKVNFIVYKNMDDILPKYENQILKGIVIEKEDTETLFKAKEELKAKYGKELHIVSSDPYNFEIMLNSSTKGNAVKILAEKFGFTSDEVICIGDSENDISMIKYAGMGVAMGNALDIVKDVADYITEDNEHSGVGKAISRLTTK